MQLDSPKNILISNLKKNYYMTRIFKFCAQLKIKLLARDSLDDFYCYVLLLNHEK